MSGFRYQVKSFLFFLLFIFIVDICLGEEGSVEKTVEEPIIVNGDTVEYSTDSREFSASGNVIVTGKGTKLTCDKLTLSSSTKDCQAEGNVRLEDLQGVIEGTKLTYNFQTKKGTIIDSEFRSSPYFGISEKQVKVSESEFLIYRGYISTCSYDNPHYRLKSRKINFFPADKVQMKDSIFYAGRIPLLYLPQYNHSLKDPIMHVQLMAGKDKEWGPYLLTAWRYSLTEDIKGRIYFDYRANYGNAQGFAVNYDTAEIGRGDFKFYYTQERDKSKKEVNIEDVNSAKVFQRYLIRLRHKWDIDEMTNAILQYYKIVDSKRIVLDSKYNILKDYFPREYEKDQLPLSYILFHRSFSHSSVDLLLQKRINRWYSQEEKLPEIQFSLPSNKIFQTPFYFENSSSYVNYNYKHAVPSPSWDDITANKFAMTNKFSLPLRVAFINLTPSVSSTQNYSDKDIYGSTLTNIFSGGSDASTKFYRIFNIKTNFLGLDINALRHIITPTLSYTYSNSTITPAGKMTIGGESSTRSSAATLGLSNKLQTKRNGNTIDILDFRVDTAYNFKTTGQKGQLSDFTYHLELLPYSWLRIYSDGTYSHSGKYFTDVNYDVDFNFSEERSFGIGQRYKRKGSNEIIYNIKWRLTPKWKFSIYHRFIAGSVTASGKGFREQEYTITRDLHCWEVDLNYNVTRNKGESVWIVFRLKAFPELEFDYNRSYNAPKPGTQGYHN